MGGVSADEIPGLIWAMADEDEQIWYATSWIKTRALRTVVRDSSRESIDRVRTHWAISLSRALHRAHVGFEQGGLHGTIAPRTIRLRADGEGFVLDDDGVAAALVAGGSTYAAILETLTARAYSGPEIQSGEKLDARSDVYALGSTLYELFTGRPLFGGRITMITMANVLLTRTGSMAISHTDHSIADALLRAIEKEPEDRWPTADAFADALTGDCLNRRTAVPLTPHGNIHSSTGNVRLHMVVATLVVLITVVVVAIALLRSHATS